MTIIHAPRYCYEKVRDMFAVRPDTHHVRFDFGWREPRKHVDGTSCCRVVFYPGDTGGKIGSLLAPKYPGQRDDGPRSLGNLGELVTVECFAINRECPEDELEQYTAVRTLWDDVYAALWRTMHGHFAIDDLKYEQSKLERRWGALIRALIVVQSRLPDTFDDDILTAADQITGTVTVPDNGEPYEVTA